MRRKWVTYIAVYAFMASVFLFFVLPLVWLILSAFDPEATIEFKIPRAVTLKHFTELIKPVGTVTPITWIVNSIVISVATATLVTILSILGGYSLTRYKFKGQEAMITTFVVLRLVPTIVIAIPIVMLYAQIGFLDTYHGLILVLTGFILPFTLLIAESYFRSLPIVYEEAAMIDGCTRFQAFMKVTLPLAIPGIATIWLLAFVISWGEFLIPLVVMRTPDMYPASVGIYFWFGVYGRVEYGRISAFSIVYSIPIIIAFLFVQKYLRRGIAGLVTR